MWRTIHQSTVAWYLSWYSIEVSTATSVGVWHCRLQTTESRLYFRFPVIFYQSVFIRKPSTFSCKKRMGSLRWRKLEVAMDFYVCRCEIPTDCRATDTEVIAYFPGLSWHRLELRIELWRRPIPGKFFYFLESCCCLQLEEFHNGHTSGKDISLMINPSDTDCQWYLCVQGSHITVAAVQK